MDYENSTHVRDWTFTTKQLEELRARSNHDAQTFILHLESAANDKGGEPTESQQQQQQQQQQSENETGREGKNALPSSLTATRIEPPVQSFAKAYKHSTAPYDPTAFQTNPAFITPQEEILLLNFYASKLLPLIGPSAAISKLKRDIKVSSTAALIFKRFYLSNSVLLFDPKIIMVASAFLASKVEDATVDVRYLEDGTRLMEAHVKVKEIVEAEVKLIKGIDFDLCCFHPYKVVLAFTEDLRTFLKSKDGRKFVTVVNKDVVSGEDLRPIYDLARDIIQKLTFTSDVMLMSSPGKIGFVAMMLANEILAAKDRNIKDENVASDNNVNSATGLAMIHIDFKGYLACRFANDKKQQEIEMLWTEIQNLFDFVKISFDQEEPDMTTLKGIHKKLKKCRLWSKEDNGGKRKKKKRKHNDDS